LIQPCAIGLMLFLSPAGSASELRGAVSVPVGSASELRGAVSVPVGSASELRSTVSAQTSAQATPRSDTAVERNRGRTDSIPSWQTVAGDVRGRSPSVGETPPNIKITRAEARRGQ